MKANDSTLNKQWASRPNDQRFLDVPSLLASVEARRNSSREHSLALDCLTLGTTSGGEIAVCDKGGPLGELSHFAFGQLCARAKAPAGYLRSLPADLAVIPLQWSLETHEATSDEGNDCKLLTRVNGHDTVAAVTSPTYGRIWDVDVVRAVANTFDLDAWRVPASSYSARDPKRATTLYASDRDIFMFLCNESTIDVDGETLRRGVILWNSEVGSATCGISTFTYDYVCDNRIIWGQDNFRELKIRHTSGGPHRFAQQAAPQLAAYAQSSSLRDATTIHAAKAYEVAKDREGVQKWLAEKGFSKGIAKNAYDAAERDPRGYNPRSVWGLVQGITDIAHDIPHTDDRTAVETRAGSLLEALAE
jgi:hypothetical protein